MSEWIAVAEAAGDWHPRIAAVFGYWRTMSPPGLLPGRQHFDPLHIPKLMPHVWMLDVVRDPLRFRYRLAGTREVQTLGRDPTGEWLDDVHPVLKTTPARIARYVFVVETGRPTWRRGNVTFIHDKDHQIVENIVLPMARDGRSVDMLFCCSVLFDKEGREIP